MKKIKGTFFVQILFTYIKEKIKLNLIKYNKSFQDVIKVSLLDFKRLSGRNIIYEEKGKGKEYKGKNGILIYEGEYKNGRRNGKGIEYDEFEGIKIYEGEFKNGKRNGKGKEYLKNGKICFEGEFKEGKKWTGVGNNNEINIYEIKEGKGKVEASDFEGIIIYKGEYFNGERHGKGGEYFNNEKIFEGEYLNGKRWNGISYDNNNNVLGELKNGKGEKIRDIIIYNGKLHEYEGEYLNGNKNGKGKEKVENKISYEGEYYDGEKKEGNLYLYNYLFQGEFINNEKKRGKEYIYEELKFEGEYLYDKYLKGTEYFKDGKKNMKVNI